MAGLTEFLHREQAQSETIPVIIAHGGYSHDFPILLASCMKHNWDKFGILTGIHPVRGQYAGSSGRWLQKTRSRRTV